jgi:AcrR family transcriptional regulator
MAPHGHLERRRRGRPPVTDEQRLRQRLRISREAVRLFGKQGVVATSGQQIAQAARVSERTLWRLFGSKETCVEPLLTTTLDEFRTVLRAWPPGVGLAEHLRNAYRFVPDSSREDIAAVLAVVRMTSDEPALRAVWLALQERAEPTFAEVLGQQLGMPADAPEIRLYAAALNAALRVAVDDFARSVVDPVTTDDVERQRRRMAQALQTIVTLPVEPASGVPT